MKQAYYFSVEDSEERLPLEMVESWVKSHYPISKVKVVELESGGE